MYIRFPPLNTFLIFFGTLFWGKKRFVRNDRWSYGDNHIMWSCHNWFFREPRLVVHIKTSQFPRPPYSVSPNNYLLLSPFMHASCLSYKNFRTFAIAGPRAIPWLLVVAEEACSRKSGFSPDTSEPISSRWQPSFHFQIFVTDWFKKLAHGSQSATSWLELENSMSLGNELALHIYTTKPWHFVRIQTLECSNPWPTCPNPRSGYFLILTTFCPDWHQTVRPKIRISIQVGTRPFLLLPGVLLLSMLVFWVAQIYVCN